MDLTPTIIAQKKKKLRSFLRIWSHLLKKPIMENFIFLWRESAIYERIKKISA